MEYAELLKRLKDDLGSGISEEAVGQMVKDAMAPLLKAEEKAIQTRVQSGNAHIVDAGSLVRTAQGSLVNPAAINGPVGKRHGNYWVELSPDMINYMENFGDIIKSSPRRRKTATEGSNEDGGFLVPEEFIASIVEYKEPANIVWPRATVIPMATDRLRMPKLAQVSDGANRDHFGGVSFSWLDETDTKTETSPNWESIALNAYKLAGYTAVSDELLMDAPINLANYLTNLLGRAWMWTTDAAFVTANGAGKPMGIVNDPAVRLVNRQTAGTVTITDINNMYSVLPSHFDTGAVWFAGKDVLAPLHDARDNNNALILRETSFALTGGLVPVMKGKPVILSDGKTPSLGNQGDVILGNWEHYFIGKRQAMDIRSSEHALFLTDMTAIRITGRIDGQAAQPRAFVILGNAQGSS
jgi:HK97 family phage major capsid protein